MANRIYTIGYECCNIANLLRVLREHNAEMVIGIRGRPISRCPEFSSEMLARVLTGMVLL